MVCSFLASHWKGRGGNTLPSRDTMPHLCKITVQTIKSEDITNKARAYRSSRSWLCMERHLVER